MDEAQEWAKRHKKACTFGGNAALLNIERTLKYGYDVKIFYIYQEPLIAWQYTRARERVEHRAIDKDGFVRSYYRTIDNLKKVGERFGANIVIDLVIKNKQNGVQDVESNVDISDIDRYVEIEYNKDKLKHLLHE